MEGFVPGRGVGVVLAEAWNWLFEWVAQNETRVWIFVVVCVVAIFLGALASLLDLGVEYGISAVAGLVVAAHAGFFLGFVVFSILFLALYIVFGYVASRLALAADLGVSAVAGLLVTTQLDILIGLCVFTGLFLAIAGVAGRMERPDPTEALGAPAS